MSENRGKRGVSGIGPMYFRRGSNSFLIHGEPFKYEFVLLSLFYHLGDIKSVCQSSSCIVQVFQELVPGPGRFLKCTCDTGWKKFIEFSPAAWLTLDSDSSFLQ